MVCEDLYNCWLLFCSPVPLSNTTRELHKYCDDVYYTIYYTFLLFTSTREVPLEYNHNFEGPGTKRQVWNEETLPLSPLSQSFSTPQYIRPKDMDMTSKGSYGEIHHGSKTSDSIVPDSSSSSSSSRSRSRSRRSNSTCTCTYVLLVVLEFFSSSSDIQRQHLKYIRSKSNRTSTVDHSWEDILYSYIKCRYEYYIYSYRVLNISLLEGGRAPIVLCTARLFLGEKS